MKVRHPLWNHEYEQQADGTVRIVDLDSGETGVYDRRGHRIFGRSHAIRSAAPGLGGRQASARSCS